MFYRDIHVFRALAILFIVAGHSRLMLNWAEDSFANNLLADFLANGTTLFVFIAGYLFQALSARYAHKRYLRSKLRNVILPYLLISIPAVIYSALYKDPVLRFPQLAETSDAFRILWFYIKGGAHLNYPLWFIPMITLYYLCAPVFMQFVRRPRLYWLIAPFFLISLFLHRDAFPNLDTLQNFVYFLAAYLAGMCAAQYRDTVSAFIARNLHWLAASYLIILVLQALFAQRHGVHGTVEWFGTENGAFDWSFLQKMVLCFLLLGISDRLQGLLYSPTKFIADSSFGVFFVHAYFLEIAPRILRPVFPGGEAPGVGTIFGLVAVIGFAAGCSMLFCYLTKRVFGDRSRPLIGY
tara:strand:- start:16794 stop:17849 length:1056 start_codon:yes stop_codon:yes gene_type:complete